MIGVLLQSTSLALLTRTLFSRNMLSNVPADSTAATQTLDSSELSLGSSSRALAPEAKNTIENNGAINLYIADPNRKCVKKIINICAHFIQDV